MKKNFKLSACLGEVHKYLIQNIVTSCWVLDKRSKAGSRLSGRVRRVKKKYTVNHLQIHVYDDSANQHAKN